MNSRLAAQRQIRAVYILGFLFSVHAVLPVYIGSTFLSTITTENHVGVIYIVASLISTLSFVGIVAYLKRFGNFRVMQWLLAIEFLAFATLSLSNRPELLIGAFIIMLVTGALIGFNLDIFLEKYSDDKTTGSVRGSFLSIVNIAWIITPLIVSFLLTDHDYWKVYALGTVLLLPIWFLARESFRTFNDPPYSHNAILETVRKVFKDGNLYRIMMSNILLNFFFAWMVIYMPLYLHNHIGLAWSQIGVILTIMLFPFVILEAPLGKIADKWLGEKEILSIGFVIISITTIATSFVTSSNMWVWAAVLFLTRVGASMVEVMNETYFFKKTRDRDASVVSLFRMTRPISYTIAPIVASLILSLGSIDTLFAVLGVIILYGLRYSLTLVDTK
jgi:MFS family permease